MRNGSHQQKNRAITELMNRIISAEDALDYEECVNSGSWPTAIEILTKRLEKAIEGRSLEGKSV
jgi:hypothetical protein